MMDAARELSIYLFIFADIETCLRHRSQTNLPQCPDHIFAQFYYLNFATEPRRNLLSKLV